MGIISCIALPAMSAITADPIPKAALHSFFNVVYSSFILLYTTGYLSMVIMAFDCVHVFLFLFFRGAFSSNEQHQTAASLKASARKACWSYRSIPIISRGRALAVTTQHNTTATAHKNHTQWNRLTANTVTQLDLAFGVYNPDITHGHRGGSPLLQGTSRVVGKYLIIVHP